MIETVNHSLRTHLKLKEALTVAAMVHDDDSDELGKALARVAAGFVHEALRETARIGRETRVGVSWGRVLLWVVEAIDDLAAGERKRLRMSSDERPFRLPGTIIWAPVVGNIRVIRNEWEAGAIAKRFADIYGGDVRVLDGGGVVPVERSDDELFKDLKARWDMILTSASDWHEEHIVLQSREVDPSLFPPCGEPTKCAGLMCNLFLKPDGRTIQGDAYYRIVGLDDEGWGAAAKRGTVVLVCGGRKRRPITLAAIRGGYVSTLVTTEKTADWLLSKIDSIDDSTASSRRSLP